MLSSGTSSISISRISEVLPEPMPPSSRTFWQRDSMEVRLSASRMLPVTGGGLRRVDHDQHDNQRDDDQQRVVIHEVSAPPFRSCCLPVQLRVWCPIGLQTPARPT